MHLSHQRRGVQPLLGAGLADEDDDEITTIEGLAATAGKDLHPMQQAWIDHHVAQCGYCQPGQIMTAVALVRRKQAAGQTVTEADLDQIRNICRWGTYARIREAIATGEAAMHTEPKPTRTKKPTPAFTAAGSP